MTAQQPAKPLTAEKAAQMGNIFRIAGALFILGGMVVGLDAGGLSTKIGFNDGSDGSLHQLIGGMFVVMGLVDFFVLPVFFKRMASKGDQTL